MDTIGTWALAGVLSSADDASCNERTATVVRVDADGTAWVHFAGGADETPVRRKLADVAVGDAVTVRVANGTASIVGSSSAPSISAARASEMMRPIADAATEASRMAGVAHDAAISAQADAGAAAAAAASAQDSADDAATAAQSAQDSADQAIADAAIAQGAAEEAQGSAATANAAAGNALTQLSIVEDVVGVLNWISEHATYKASTDTEVVPGKYYFTKSGNVYSIIANPTGNPSTSGYYEIDDIDEAVSNYVASHLALDSAGLWIVNDSNSYRLLAASDGIKIYDAQGNLVSTFGESITFSAGRVQYIGNDNAFIIFEPQSGSTPAQIRIGGNVIMGSSKTLSEILADVEDAKQTALDAATLVITSTNGQLFKNGEESTILQVVVFPSGGDRCDTITQVRARFGSSAYIQWKWKHEDSGEWGTLVSTDSHISHDGMWLTVTPEDVATKTTFSASLITS